MYAVADKYGIPGLKSLSLQKLNSALQDTSRVASLLGYTPKMTEEFMEAVQAVWTLTPESDNGVRAVLLDHALTNKETLLQTEKFKLVIQQVPQFACDLLAQPQIRKSAQPLLVYTALSVPGNL